MYFHVVRGLLCVTDRCLISCSTVRISFVLFIETELWIRRGLHQPETDRALVIFSSCVMLPFLILTFWSWLLIQILTGWRLFHFPLLSKGESGLGKSTLINSLFLTDLYPERVIPGAAGKTHNALNDPYFKPFFCFLKAYNQQIQLNIAVYWKCGLCLCMLWILALFFFWQKR